MRLQALSILLLGIASPMAAARTTSDPGEFISLGCPSTTKLNASRADQLAAWTDFTDLLYANKQVEDALSTYVAAKYINHSPNVVANGDDEASSYLAQATPAIDAELHHVYVGWDSNGTAYGTVHSKATINGTDEAVVDIIRMVGTCLVEHWGAQQVMVASENPIAYF